MLRFPGAAYIDIDENGVPRVAPAGFPGDGLCRATRCSRSGVKVAGFDGSDNVYEWVGGQWEPRGKSFGGRAVIYRGEELVVRREWPGVGFRYVRPDGSIATAEETYAYPTLAVWEYTVLPNGWIVGQGGNGPHGEDPVVILPGDGTRRLVKAGQCRFINAYLVGDRVDMAWQEPDGCDAKSLSLAEVLVLPVADAPEPTHTDAPPHTDVPPTPEPTPMPQIPAELTDQLALVTEVRNTLFPDKIGQPLHDGEKAALMAKHVAWRLRHLGVGLAKAKPGSSNHGGACPEAPEGITTDIVALANGVHWDIQVDGHDGAAFPRWALEENPANYPPIGDRWIPAVSPGVMDDEPQHNDAPPPPPAKCDCADQLAGLNDRLKLMEHQLRVSESVIENMRQGLAEMQSAIAKRRAFRVKGVTSRSFGHGHTIDLHVIEE